MKLDDRGLPVVKESNVFGPAFFSVFFHILLFVVLPLLLNYFHKEPKIDKPEAFELVAIPNPVDNMSPEIPMSEPEQPEPVEEVVEEPVEIDEPVPTVSTKPVKNPEPKPEPKVVKNTEPAKDSKPKVSKQQVSNEIDNLFDGPTNKGGSNSQGTAAEESYEGKIRRRIQQNWNTVLKDSVVIRYVVSRNGHLKTFDYIKKSTNPTLNLLAKNAVELAFPVDPIPVEIEGATFSRIYTLAAYKKNEKTK